MVKPRSSGSLTGPPDATCSSSIFSASSAARRATRDRSRCGEPRAEACATSATHVAGRRETRRRLWFLDQLDPGRITTTWRRRSGWSGGSDPASHRLRPWLGGDPDPRGRDPSALGAAEALDGRRLSAARTRVSPSSHAAAGFTAAGYRLRCLAVELDVFTGARRTDTLPPRCPRPIHGVTAALA